MSDELKPVIIDYGIHQACDEEIAELTVEIERLKEAMTGWYNYAWRNGEYIDCIQEFFDAVIAGKTAAEMMKEAEDVDDGNV